MTYFQWPLNVNSKFFSYQEKPQDNVTMVEFLSGRKVGYQINTRKSFEISCKLRLSVEKELPLFWEFFSSIGGTSGGFVCDDLGEHVYRFKEVPQPQDTNRNYRVLSLNLEQVF